jgi:aryl-alcohol dehydrogenase-like predicted oxidoreductase
METTPLGTTGESVSALCLGTMYFGSRTDPETSRAILDAYYEAGGRFLDTANKYATWLDGYDEPESEPLLGEWMAERGIRDELFVATKVGFPYPGAGALARADRTGGRGLARQAGRRHDRPALRTRRRLRHTPGDVHGGVPPPGRRRDGPSPGGE